MTRSSVGRMSTPSRFDSVMRPLSSGLFNSLSLSLALLGASVMGHEHHKSLGKYSRGQAYAPSVSGALTMLALKWRCDPTAGWGKSVSSAVGGGGAWESSCSFQKGNDLSAAAAMWTPTPSR